MRGCLSSGWGAEVQHEVFAPPMPARLRQPTPEPVPRQEGRALPAARRISVNEGPRWGLLKDDP